jgi:hypothetical protein
MSKAVKYRGRKWKNIYFIIQALEGIGLRRVGYVFSKRQAVMTADELKSMGCDTRIVAYSRAEVEELKGY